MDDDLWPGIAERITEARDGAGLDQTELGEAIGLSKGAVGNYERGDRTPSLAALHQIARATGRDIHWLISGATYQDPLHRIEDKLDRLLKQMEATALSDVPDPSLPQALIDAEREAAEFLGKPEEKPKRSGRTDGARKRAREK
jgi:transcriptional regulator with XRE-family HTH domain